jgi:hypothetical protein
MGIARDADPVKLVASVLTGQVPWLEEAKVALVQAFGVTDLESDLLPFDHTDYYAGEFGTGLLRQLLSFRRLVSPADLPSIKLWTNELEKEWLTDWCEGHVGKRRVNIDPGYISLGKLVLASTKDHAHRLYLGHGIYGEVTLAYQRGRFRPWIWTYPDYANDRYCEFFGKVRDLYKAQLGQATLR